MGGRNSGRGAAWLLLALLAFRSLRPAAVLPPGRAQLPLLGDTLRLLNPKTMASYQLDSREKWGAVWKTNVLFKPAVFVTGSQLLSEAFQEEAKKKTKAFFPPHQKSLFGKHALLVQSGPFHGQVRRTVQQSLTPAAVREYEELIAAEVQDFVDSCKARKGTFPLVPELRTLMTKVMLRVLLGRSAADEVVSKLLEDVTIWSQGLVSAPLLFIPWSTAARAMRARARIATMLEKWIEEGGDGLLGRLKSAKDPETGEGLTTESIVDNVLTLVFAGSDTTASSVSSAFQVLSQDEALQQELREASGKEGAAEVLDAFMAEAMRSNPPAPFAMRLVDGEPLEVGGFEVPPGWLIAYGFAGTLTGDTSEYPKPHSFDAQRFREGAAKQLAFGGGPRMCPGRFLAVAESRILMQAVLGEGGFAWRLEEGQDLSKRYNPGYFPVDGLKVEVLES